MYKIGIVTGTRAEYGLLKPLIEKIHTSNEFELCLIVTGAHLEERFGSTCQEIIEDGNPISFKVPMELNSDKPRGICKSMGRELEELADAFEHASLDLLLLLGDRYETLIAAIAAMMFQIPIAHLYGGEITEGAMDDAIRHSISKMSAIHFTSTDIYAKRLQQMGEPPERIFCVGALGVENVKKIRYLSRDDLCADFSPLFGNPYIMVTYHPVTLEKNTAKQQFRQLLQVISRKKNYNYIFTYANADAEGDAINSMIDCYVREHENACAFRSMGQRGYLSALKFARCVMGNSSSGIVEAPSFHIPTVNIGDRQKGRVCSKTVISCGNSEEEITEALTYALSDGFSVQCNKYDNPYEGKDTSKNVIDTVKEMLSQGIDSKKKFIDKFDMIEEIYQTGGAV